MKRFIVNFMLGVLLGITVVVVAVVPYAKEPSITKAIEIVSKDLTKIFVILRDHNVRIDNKLENVSGSGGVIVYKGKRYILTAAHLVLKADLVSVTSMTSKPDKYRAKVIDKDDVLDLALLEVGPISIEGLKVAKTTPIPGTTIYSVSNPLLMENMFLVGYVAGEIDKKEQDFPVLMDSLSGSSGGLIVNENLEVVAVTQNLLRGSRYNRQVTTECINEFLERVTSDNIRK